MNPYNSKRINCFKFLLFKLSIIISNLLINIKPWCLFASFKSWKFVLLGSDLDEFLKQLDTFAEGGTEAHLGHHPQLDLIKPA